MTREQEEVIKGLQFVLDEIKSKTIEAMDQGKDVAWSYTRSDEDDKSNHDCIITFTSDDVPLFEIKKY